MSLSEIVYLLPVLAVGGAAAIHAAAYLHGEARRRLPGFLFLVALTSAAMAAVVFADGRLPFLLAWEAMGLTSFALVAFDAKEKTVRRAAWIYLIACQAGACALMLGGVLLSRPGCQLAAFACAVIGFGLKIGFPPFHSWLPEAHPAAPAPASAIMSGAMIPLGFCGMMKFFPLTGNTADAGIYGWTLIALGVSGAIGGMLFALAQANLKRLLAFSSVENMGVIAMGLGLAALAAGRSAPGQLAAICTAGALAHILNHAFLKGALFLAAGSVLRQTGTLDQDRLGGLLRRMPMTGTLFTVNAFALSGLPPLNGFLGELAIYIGAFSAIRSGDDVLASAGFIVAVSLALTGALAVAAYAKAIGCVFLGEPRSAAAGNAVETPACMYIAQLFLSLISIVMIPGTVFIVHHLAGGAATVPMITAAGASLAFAGVVGALLPLRRFACARGAQKPRLPVWDCGYAHPTPRMAYTATAFTQPLVDLLRPVLRPRRHVIPFTGDPAAPSDAAIAEETDDIALAALWRPLFTRVARIFQRAHLLQNGSLHLYILIILLAVLTLLVSALVS